MVQEGITQVKLCAWKHMLLFASTKLCEAGFCALVYMKSRGRSGTDTRDKHMQA